MYNSKIMHAFGRSQISVLYHPNHATLEQLMYNAILFIKSIGKNNLQMNVKP